jgi:predicted aspartyl protease
MRTIATAEIVSLFCLLACWTSPVRAQTCIPQEIAALPIASLPSGLTSVQVSINGQSATMVVDTGAIFGVLTETAARKLALNVEGSGRPMGVVYGGELVRRQAQVASFQLGSMPGMAYRFGVARAGSSLASEADGLISADILSAYTVSMDFHEGRMALFAKDGCYTGDPGSHTAPLRYSKDGHIHIPVELDGASVDGIIDSGAERSVISLKAVQSLSPDRLRQQDLKPVRFDTINGVATAVYDYRFGVLHVAGLEIPDPQIEIVDQHGIPVSGLILGMNVLRRLKLGLAFGKSTVYLAPISEPR